MSDEATETFVCGEDQHHWVSSHEPHAPIWIIKCSQCERHDFTEMLAAHDREVAAKALRDVADHVTTPRMLWQGSGGVTVYDNEQQENESTKRPLQLGDWLRARAAALVSEPSTSEGEKS